MQPPMHPMRIDTGTTWFRNRAPFLFSNFYMFNPLSEQSIEEFNEGRRRGREDIFYYIYRVTLIVNLAKKDAIQLSIACIYLNE